MSLKLNSSGGGSVTLQEPSTASNRTLTLPDNTGNLISSADSGTVSQAMLASGVAGNGPSFRASRNTTTSLSSGVLTKAQLNTEQWDTANCFDSSTNYRFTPNVAGYYQINTSAYFSSGSFSGNAYAILYKNGSVYSYGTAVTVSAVSTGADVVYLNGTTDYIELYVQAFGTGLVLGGDSSANYTFMSGSLVRSA